MKFPKQLVSVGWLAEHLDDTDLVILDASLPKPKSNPANNPLSSLQIPKTRFFDINGSFSDTSSDLPHMMPTPAHFQEHAQKLGVNQNSRIVVYDNIGVYSSPRARWMFKSMGHEHVAVLDGGLPEWVKEFPTESKQENEYPAGNFTAKFNSNYFKKATEVLAAISDDTTTIVDARSAGRFQGTEPEPRAGLRGGHIPNSKNVPFPEMIDGNQMKSNEELKSVFENKVQSEQIIFSCGSGLTACIIALGAEIAGYGNLSVYDGSWSEWGIPSDLPVITPSV